LQKNYNFFSAVISIYNQILTMTLKSQLLRILILRIANSNSKRIEYFCVILCVTSRSAERGVGGGGGGRGGERGKKKKRREEGGRGGGGGGGGGGGREREREREREKEKERDRDGPVWRAGRT